MKINIAEIDIEIQYQENLLKNQLKKYQSTDEKSTLEINYKSSYLIKDVVSPALQEYITTGLAFARALLDFNGFCLHSSAIAVDNKAVLFAAKSGTGKSTHTRLWREYFGEDKAIMINDDKPAIRLMEDGVFYAYGTPWSGKTDLNTNVKVPLAAIVLLERSDTNWIELVNRREAVMQIYVHALKPEDGDKDKTIKLMDIVGKTAEKIPVYRMGCTISEEAVKLAYEATILGKIRK